jgi:hypothetical protein
MKTLEELLEELPLDSELMKMAKEGAATLPEERKKILANRLDRALEKAWTLARKELLIPKP